MERFSYPDQQHNPLEGRGLPEHVVTTKEQPVLGIIRQADQADILAFAGENQGLAENQHDAIQVLQGEEKIPYTHQLDEYTFLLGTDEVTAYVLHHFDNWQTTDPLDVEHLTTTLGLLTAIKQFDIATNFINVDGCLAEVWDTATRSIHTVHERQKIVDFAYTCLDSELAPTLHEYATRSMEDISSYKMIDVNPLLDAYIETQIEGQKTLEKELEVIRILAQRAKALEKDE